MIVEVLYPLVFAEMGLILTLSFQSPLKRLVVRVLDLTKRGRGPVVVHTLSATLLLVFVSSLHDLTSIRGRVFDAGGAANPTHQVVMAYRLLEASLLGFSMFLALVIDRLHSYLREVHILRKKCEDYEQLRHEEEQGPWSPEKPN